MHLTFWSTISLFISLGCSNPILRGQDVGKLQQIGQLLQMSGQEQYPFMAHLLIMKIITVTPHEKRQISSRCGGVIISENAVLTAAHCIKDAITDVDPEVFVTAGRVHLEYENGVLSKMKTYTIHEEYIGECILSEYVTKFCFNDIAIVWLENPFVFGSTINKADLIDPTDNPSKKSGWILGWGLNEYGIQMQMLQKAYMNVIPNDECQVINHEVVIADHMICLMSETKTSSSCDGDSGGPFVVDGKVYGISSFHMNDDKNECNPTYPVMYTNIGDFKGWITKKLLNGPSPLRSSLPCCSSILKKINCDRAKPSRFRSENGRIKGKLVSS